MLAVRDFITTPGRAIRKSDAKTLLMAMEKEYKREGGFILSFQDVPYVATVFVAESLGSFLHANASTFESRARMMEEISIHDYQSDVQKVFVEACVRHFIDRRYHENWLELFKDEPDMS